MGRVFVEFIPRLYAVSCIRIGRGDALRVHDESLHKRIRSVSPPPLPLPPSHAHPHSAIPTPSSSDAASLCPRDSPHVSPPAHRDTRHTAIYDDPRSPPPPAATPRPARPAFLRHLTDQGPRPHAATPRVGSASRERDRSVRVNLMAAAAATTARRGWGMSSATGTTRMNRMADGPDGMYAVGGGQCGSASPPCLPPANPAV